MSPPTLMEIVRRATERLEQRMQSVAFSDLLARAEAARTPHPFLAAFSGEGIHVIAEVKRRSPSLGAIAPEADPVDTAGKYLEAGAAAVSVLTEGDYFGGSLEFLSAVRARFPEARLLMKDFIVDKYQLAEGRAFGADACLLMASVLDDARLEALYRFARGLKLTPLVEVHDEAELQRAVRLGAELIGVNNRNLTTMEVTRETSLRLAPKLPRDGVICLSESGISAGHEIRELYQAGYRGFLVGGSLMKNPGENLARLIREAK